MKIANKFFIYIIGIILIMMLSSGLFFYFALLPLFDELYYFQTFEQIVNDETQLAYITLGALSLFTFVYILLLFLYVKSQVIRPLLLAIEFSNKLADGSFPTKLPYRKTHDEISDLNKSLNFLRDRLNSSLNRLKVSHEHEKEARIEAEKANEMRTNFVSRLSPELRTPLNAINGFCSILHDQLKHKTLNDSDAEVYLNALTRNVENLNQQIARILDINRLAAASGALNITTFETADFMHSLIDYNTYYLNRQSIDLMNHYSPDMPLYLNTDRELLELILGILIRSVGNVSSPNEVISFTCHHENGQIYFHIHDFRRGECTKDLVALFNQQMATPDPAMPNADMSHLSLFFAATKSTLLNGTLTAKTTPKAHIEFKLSFPEWEILPVNDHNNKTGAVINSGESSQNNLNPIHSNDSNPAAYNNILLAEMDPDNALAAATILEAPERRIKIVADADTMLAALNANCYDLLILALPYKYEELAALVNQIRDIEKYKKLHIIFISCFFDEKYRKQLSKLNINNYMIKPLDFNELRNLVNN